MLVKAFIVVYLHSFQPKKVITQTLDRNKGNQLVEKYLKAFSHADSYLDWADDPSFFCVQEMLGDIRQSSWGVCRRDVRKQLQPSDLVVFFCGKRILQKPKEWRYYFIGFGTVKETLSREEIWENEKYSAYRDFYNILARPENGQLVQDEIIGMGHEDWRNRLTAPYIIFDSDPTRTYFCLEDPLEVAIKKEDKYFEEWNYSDPKVKELRYILFDQFGIKRNLRTNSIQPHRHIAIHKTEPIEKTADLIGCLPSQLHRFVN
jgi:hypothetical protein